MPAFPRRYRADTRRLPGSVDRSGLRRKIVAEEVLQRRSIEIARLLQRSQALLGQGDFPAHLAPTTDTRLLGLDLLLEGRESSEQLCPPDLADAFTIHSPSS